MVCPAGKLILSRLLLNPCACARQIILAGSGYAALASKIVSAIICRKAPLILRILGGIAVVGRKEKGRKGEKGTDTFYKGICVDFIKLVQYWSMFYLPR